MKVLVVDDDRGLRQSLTMILEDGGHAPRAAADAREGLEAAEAFQPDLVLVDYRMPEMDGLDFLKAYREAGGGAPVIVMTAYGSMELAVEALKAGAYDYLPKPFGAEEVLLTLRKAVERESLRREVGRLREEVAAGRRFGEIVASAPAMIRVVETARKVARHPTSVLIQGPTGTGKELLARLIHQESERGEGAFVAVNCGAIPDTLLDSEFFGHVKGAFSGADRDRAGLFEAAQGGTLFLDEIAEIPEPLQVKLLRALQEGEVRRVGESESRPVDVRIVAATNRTLAADVEEGRFRGDLFYRIAVVTLEVPPLRSRPEDLVPLTQHLLERHAARMGMTAPALDREAVRALSAYAWPGNVRELENVLERAMVLSDGEQIGLGDLPDHIREGREGPAPAGGQAFGSSGSLPGPSEGDDLSVKRRSAELERELIRRALARTGGNRTRAAELLELSDRALRYKIRDYELE